MCVPKRWLIGYPTHAVLLAPADMRCSAAFLDWCHIAVRGCEAPGIRSLWGFPAAERLTGMSNIWGSTSFFLAKKHAPIWHTIYPTNWFWNMDLATLLMFHKQMESGHPRSFAIPSISTLEPKKIIVHQPIPMISHFRWSTKKSAKSCEGTDKEVIDVRSCWEVQSRRWYWTCHHIELRPLLWRHAMCGAISTSGGFLQ